MVIMVWPGMCLGGCTDLYVFGITFLEDESISVMDWPARSPDLNPIKPGTYYLGLLEAKNILQIMFNVRTYAKMTSLGSSGVCHIIAESV